MAQGLVVVPTLRLREIAMKAPESFTTEWLDAFVSGVALGFVAAMIVAIFVIVVGGGPCFSSI